MDITSFMKYLASVAKDDDEYWVENYNPQLVFKGNLPQCIILAVNHLGEDEVLYTNLYREPYNISYEQMLSRFTDPKRVADFRRVKLIS